MKLRARLMLVLTALSLGLVVFASPAAPAWACSCAVSDSQEQADRAEVIVVGTVTAVSDSRIRLAVEAVEKGNLGNKKVLTLRANRDPSSCGFDFRAGVRYRVHSTVGSTGLCSGNVRLPAASPALGSAPVAAPVEPVLAEPTKAEPAPVEPVLAEPTPGEPALGQSAGWWWFAAGAALGAAIAGAVTLALRRRWAGQASHGQ